MESCCLPWVDFCCRTGSGHRKALAVDLIEVRRLERILIEALEAEGSPAAGAAAVPPGRYARPGSAFAHCGGASPFVELAAIGNERAVTS